MTIALKIEGKEFSSIKEACEYMKWNPGNSGLYKALINNKPTFKGLSIERVEPLKPKARDLNSERFTKVKCIMPDKTEHIFSCINAAAKFAKADHWTMSKKMEAAGKFIDSLGREYIRLKPMRTKNVYVNTGPTLSKTYNTSTSKIKSVEKPKPIDNMDLAKTILKEKAIEYIQKNDFKTAIDLITVVDTLK